MGDLRNPRILYIKGFSFLLIGLLASLLVVIRVPQFDVLALHAIAIWAFARAYYFAFYVIEHYIDPSFKFAGLIAFARYLVSARKKVNHS